ARAAARATQRGRCSVGLPYGVLRSLLSGVARRIGGRGCLGRRRELCAPQRALEALTVIDREPLVGVGGGPGIACGLHGARIGLGVVPARERRRVAGGVADQAHVVGEARRRARIGTEVVATGHVAAVLVLDRPLRGARPAPRAAGFDAEQVVRRSAVRLL